MRQVLELVRLDDPGAAEAAFRADVDLAEPVRAAWLHVGGIATVWEVLVDGVVVAADSSMFARPTVPLGALAAGPHRVEVRCHPLAPVLDAVPRRPRQRWRTALVDDARLRWVRTTVLGRAPGFAPGPAVVGPVRPLVLETSDPHGVRVAGLRLRPALDGDRGLLGIDLEIDGPDADLDVDLEVEVAGQRHPLAVRRGGARVELDVGEVAAWWPSGHGPAARHAVRLLHDGAPLDLPGDGTLDDPTVRQVGFRRLANADPSTVALVVNDVPVFVRGVVWTPGDLDALDEAARLGFNLVRVPGTAGYESDAFHARCDALGLMVWHDLPFATLDYPLADEEFAARVRTEVGAQLPRLHGHPSTVVVCGSAEHEQQAAMMGLPLATLPALDLAAFLRPLVEEVGLDAVWVDSSPTGGVPPTRVDEGVAQYFGVGAYRRPETDVRLAGVRFAAECLAFANLPADGRGADGEGVPRDQGADWDFADVREHYARARHGDAPTLEQRQRVTGEVMAEVFAHWRGPGSRCGGGIVLWLRDLHPGAGWGLLDHTGTPKPCAEVLAPALAPAALWLRDDGLNGVAAVLVNDTRTPLEGRLRVALVRDDGSEVDAGETALRLEPGERRAVDVESLLGRFADPAHAYRFGPAAHTAVVAELTGDVERRAVWTLPRPS